LQEKYKVLQVHPNEIHLVNELKSMVGDEMAQNGMEIDE
jgi:hypothetical protein